MSESNASKINRAEGGYNDRLRDAACFAKPLLESAGIKPGAIVRRMGKTYRITEIDFSRNSHDPRHGGTIWAAGNRLRKDGTFGTWVHGIGCPSDLEVLPSLPGDKSDG